MKYIDDLNSYIKCTGIESVLICCSMCGSDINSNTLDLPGNINEIFVFSFDGLPVFTTGNLG
jgi:hypothetical protein